MSLESSQAFFIKLQTNREFADKLQKENGMARRKLIAKAGFDFTDAELKQEVSEVGDTEIAGKANGDVWRNSCCTNKKKWENLSKLLHLHQYRVFLEAFLFGCKISKNLLMNCWYTIIS